MNLGKAFFAVTLIAITVSVKVVASEGMPENISPLMGRAADLDVECRLGSEDQKGVLDACSERDAVLKKLEAEGWCHNEYTVTVGRPPKEWQPCKEARPPRYDVSSYCSNIASLNGTRSESIFAECMRSEQASYDEMKKAWVYLPQQVKDYCSQIATVGGEGAYSVLETCARQEMVSKRKNDTTQFHY